MCRSDSVAAQRSGSIARVTQVDAGWWEWRLRQRGAPLPGATATAQETYAGLVRDLLSPAFREAGLTGSGGRYALPTDGGWALVGLQKSAYSDKAEIRFTVNLFAVSHRAWAEGRDARPYLPSKPSAGTIYGVGANARLGTLLPEGEDIWWRVIAGHDPTAVAAAAISAVVGYGIPWLSDRVAEF